MLVRVFTLVFDPATGRFNDEAVREFLADQEVVSIHDHFFVKESTPYLALVACYRPRALLPPVPNAQGGRQRDESWREVLAKEDWPLFNALRDWRGERARREGIPTYVVCNNRQLAEVVSKRPATLSELGHINGFGDAKLKKYGKEMLAIITRAGTAPKEVGDAED